MQVAWAASSLGGWAFFVALSVYAYGHGGAAAVGIAAVVRMAPAALAAPAKSLLGDRYPRRDVLLVLALARAAVLAAAAALVAADGPVAAVFLLGAAFTAVGTGHRPAQAALLPSLADDPRQLAASNAVWSAVDSVGFLAGALAGGTLIATGGVDLALAATAITFLLAALALAGIPADRRPEPPPAGPHARRAAELAEGFATVRKDRSLRLVVGVLGASTLVEGAIDVLVVLVALELLDLGAAGVGWLNSAWGVGGVLGGAGAMLLVARGRNAAALVLSSLLIGAPLLALSALPSTALALTGLVVLGVGYAVLEVAGLTLVQRLASDAVLARAFGVVEGTYWLTTGLGSLLAPLLVAALGLRGALLVAGAALPAVVLARARTLTRLEASAPVPEREYRLLRALAMFAPLPVARLEELARRLTPVHLGAGETIIREGEPGDRFYVIAAGEVDVTEQGRFRRTEPAGDCFGEIALLREVPRTATVSARTDVDLLALEREEFLAAITGDRRALAAGHDLVAARLAPV
ncbi:MAG TPA: cyclic nucleotide-binding domain-containing protein [Solirubrobacter sp.]|nr:cyclic nucleotide-binding domain-containing protein [Solirubrobacter sp.]